ncbi:class I SAM-dependent methyltransferase [Magnetovibrio blakemorei]|uniref:Methyltransferase type 11 domain-containing protein n=1 Tax=Magnetovibrio blakemorei TaxID=28181 RepID=A0A1E5Q4C3_9PROT|nr:class I SAM-dependent methyltransferase [Magnetovibrio blakemorei]OEJ64162.1 hypothetical protein BEN30_16990 [Magnetovibrio blakemorei]
MHVPPQKSIFSLTKEDFLLPDSDIQKILDLHETQKFNINDSEWKEISNKEISQRRLGIRRYLHRLIEHGRNTRTQVDVQSSYNTHWNLTDTLSQYIEGLNTRNLALQWRQQGIICASQALRQIDLLFYIKAIETVRPKSVLEIGCGNSSILLTLAARFPEISFFGIELTESGVNIAKSVQELDELPPSIVKNSPVPLVDLTAHRLVKLQIGDARNLPFPDNHFDLIYTRLALEQMEQIREKVLKEIYRVSNGVVALVECWRDFNLTGPGRDYIHRSGYFTGKIRDLEKLGFNIVLATADVPQKIQFSSGPVVGVKK